MALSTPSGLICSFTLTCSITMSDFETVIALEHVIGSSSMHTSIMIAEMNPTLIATASDVTMNRPRCNRISLIASHSITPPDDRG